MARREQRIAARLDEAQERERQAAAEVQHYRDQAAELEHGREALLTRARDEAEQQKKQLLEEARAQVAETRSNWQRQAVEEKEEFLANLRRQAAGAVQAVAQKALRDLADAELEERVIHVFLTRLEALDRETRQGLVQAGEPVRIRSAFALDATMRGRLTRALHAHLGADIEVKYSQSPDLLCGIELSGAERRLGWNLAEYLEALTTRVDAAFTPVTPAREEA
jgi:F-type H+-transporting ATPase subunit b